MKQHRLLHVLLLPLALCGCLESAFYYPDRVVYDTPARAGLRFEEVRFTSKDGTALSGWFIPAKGYSNPKDAKGTVIHFHGNAQNMSAHWAFVAWLPPQGFNVFVFDYRGYGKSEGSPEPKGVFEDSDAALSVVRSRPDVDPQRLLVFGQSLGGTNAIAVVGAGNRAGVKAVAIEATFFSYSSIAGEKIAGAGFLMDDTYSAKNYIGEIAPIPLLLMHGTSDAVIPYTHALKLMDRARQPKSLIRVEGAGHLEMLSGRLGDRYQRELLSFFDGALSSQR